MTEIPTRCKRENVLNNMEGRKLFFNPKIARCTLVSAAGGGFVVLCFSRIPGGRLLCAAVHVASTWLWGGSLELFVGLCGIASQTEERIPRKEPFRKGQR